MVEFQPLQAKSIFEIVVNFAAVNPREYHTMNILNRVFQYAALCGGAFLLCCSLAAGADEMQDINTMFKQGQKDQALERVNAYLKSKPKDAQARFLKGLILTEQGKVTDAISLFSALTEDYPELPEPYNNLAVLYAGQGQYDKARISLEMAIRTHPSYATAHENLGDIYAKMASQAYDRALQLDKSNASTQTKLAMIKDLFTGGKSSKPVTAARSVASGSTTKQQPVAPATTPTPDKVATAVPAPANAGSTTATTDTPAPTDSRRDEVLKALQDWAAAWSSKNGDAYLSFYAGDFKTPKGEARAAWEAERKDRISKPKSIRVIISNANVSFTDDNHATATFRQSYRASHLSNSSRKTMQLIKTDGKWLIQEERSGK